MKKLSLILWLAVALAFIATPALIQAQDSTLIGYWNFNECLGDTAHDNSIYQNNGVRIGAEWVNWGSGNCGLYFDTTYEYVRVPNSPSISDLSQITVEAMVTVDSLPAEPYCHVIVEKEYAYAFYIQSADSCLWAGVWDPGSPGTWIVLSSSSKIPIGEPVYVAFTADKVTKEMKIYINGQLDTTKTDDRLPYWIDGHHDLFFGVDYGYGWQWFAQFFGKMDWIRIWRTVKEPQLCAYWNFDEGSGDTAHDLSVNGNHGTIYGASWTNQGRFNGALSFDGENDYIMVPNSASLNSMSQITIEAWVYLEHYPTGESGHGSELVLQKEGTYQINIRRDGVPYFAVCNGDNPNYMTWYWEGATAQDTMPLHQWTHLAGTFDKTTKEMKFFVNGNLQETKIFSSWTSWYPGHNLYIACNRDIYNEEYFPGKIDEVKIWNVLMEFTPLCQDSLFVSSDAVCLDPRLHKVPLVVKNLGTLKAMTIPLHPDITCPNFAVDSVSFVGTRIDYWDNKTVVIGPDSIVLGLVADMNNGTPPLPPGEGAIAYIYYTINCDTAHTGETCYFSLDTTTIQPENQHLLFVDNHNYEFIPYFEPGTTTVNLYRPGDANCNCEINIGDVVALIGYLFKNGPEPCPLDAGDVNGNCTVDLGDAVYLITYLYKGGSPPVCGCASNPLLAGCCGISPTLQKTAGLAEVGLVASESSKEDNQLLEVDANFDVEVAGVQLELSYDPKEIQSIIPELTDRTKDLSIFFSAENGKLKVGILDLTGEHLISAEEGALVRLSISGFDVSSLELQNAILVDEHATPFEVTILSKEEKQAAIPKDFALAQNVPNPFNPETEISYSLPHDSYVKLAIYNVRGQKVKTLVNGFESTGHKSIRWDGTDEVGQKVASGIYFYRLEAGDFKETRKMVMMK